MGDEPSLSEATSRLLNDSSRQVQKTLASAPETSLCKERVMQKRRKCQETWKFWEDLKYMKGFHDQRERKHINKLTPFRSGAVLDGLVLCYCCEGNRQKSIFARLTVDYRKVAMARVALCVVFQGAGRCFLIEQGWETSFAAAICALNRPCTTSVKLSRNAGNSLGFGLEFEKFGGCGDFHGFTVYIDSAASLAISFHSLRDWHVHTGKKLFRFWGCDLFSQQKTTLLQFAESRSVLSSI